MLIPKFCKLALFAYVDRRHMVLSFSCLYIKLSTSACSLEIVSALCQFIPQLVIDPYLILACQVC